MCRQGAVKLAAERAVVHASRLHEPAEHTLVLKSLQTSCPADKRKDFVDYCRRAVAKLSPDSGDESDDD